MAKFRKKPIVIEAFLWTAGPDQTEDPEWMVEALEKGTARILPSQVHSCRMKLDTGDGEIIIVPPIWIIRGVRGEIYPCNIDVFEATYEAVNG